MTIVLLGALAGLTIGAGLAYFIGHWIGKRVASEMVLLHAHNTEQIKAESDRLDGWPPTPCAARSTWRP